MSYLDELPIEMLNLIIEYCNISDLMNIYLIDINRCCKIFTKQFFKSKYTGNLRLIHEYESCITSNVFINLVKIQKDHLIITKAENIVNNINRLTVSGMNMCSCDIKFQLNANQMNLYLYLDIVKDFNEARYYVSNNGIVTFYLTLDLHKGKYQWLLTSSYRSASRKLKTNIYKLLIDLIQNEVPLEIGDFD